MGTPPTQYFTALQTERTRKYKPAPPAVDANRLESRIQTTNVPIELFRRPAATTQQQICEAWFKGWVVTDRRYPVLDERYGIVLAIVLMQISPSHAVPVGVPHDGPTGWN